MKRFVKKPVHVQLHPRAVKAGIHSGKGNDSRYYELKIAYPLDCYPSSQAKAKGEEIKHWSHEAGDEESLPEVPHHSQVGPPD